MYDSLYHTLVYITHIIEPGDGDTPLNERDSRKGTTTERKSLTGHIMKSKGHS